MTENEYNNFPIQNNLYFLGVQC